MPTKNLFTVLSLIHGSLVLGLLVFSGFVYWKNSSFNTDINQADIFIYMVPLVAAAGYFLSKSLYQKQIQKIDGNNGLSNKLNRYQTASIIKFALLEVPAILALVAYYYNGNAIHLVIALCLIAYLISQRPTQKRFQNDMPLTLEEQQQLDI